MHNSANGNRYAPAEGLDWRGLGTPSDCPDQQSDTGGAEQAQRRLPIERLDLRSPDTIDVFQITSPEASALPQSYSRIVVSTSRSKTASAYCPDVIENPVILIVAGGSTAKAPCENTPNCSGPGGIWARMVLIFTPSTESVNTPALA